MIINPFIVKPPAVLVYRGSQSQSANVSSYTYTNAPIGPASNDRYVYVVVWFREDTGLINFSCTIGGVTATKIQGDIADSLGRSKGAIFGLLVTSGTTSTIVVSAGGITNQQMMGVYTATGTTNGLIPLNSYSINTASTPLSLNIVSPAQGFFLSVYGTTGPVPSVTVTNAKLDFSAIPLVNSLNGISTMNTGPYTVTATPSISQTQQAFFGVTLR